jgi:hypothetical protein
MEEHRRTEEGRVRTAREMLDFFFPRTSSGAEDRLFIHIPQTVRGPIISAWGIRGHKSAVRDTNEKVREVVFDAIVAGDVDEVGFEEGVDAETLIDWVPLADWWAFWRSGKLTGVAIQKALGVARELGIFDDRWFFQNVEGRGGRLKGTDTICDTLSKDQIVAWLRNVHQSGDGSPAGLVQALGWETILAKTQQEALLFSLDALAAKIGLVGQSGATEKPAAGTEEVVVPAIAPSSPPKLEASVPISPTSDSDLGGAPPSSRRPAPAQSGTIPTVDVKVGLTGTQPVRKQR